MRVQSFILNNSDVQLLANSYIFINRNCRETGKGERRRDKQEVKRKQTRHIRRDKARKETRKKKKKSRLTSTRGFVLFVSHDFVLADFGMRRGREKIIVPSIQIAREYVTGQTTQLSSLLCAFGCRCVVAELRVQNDMQRSLAR